MSQFKVVNKPVRAARCVKGVASEIHIGGIPAIIFCKNASELVTVLQSINIPAIDTKRFANMLVILESEAKK